ncbi:MAG TPA: hypothetical protein VGG27_18885 [Magnetospirillaceae bacterium]
MPNVTVQPVHFEDFSGVQFERLVFAYHLAIGWKKLAWFGQTGSDLGRDIVGVGSGDDGIDRATIIQCVNRTALTLPKAKRDMKKAIGSPTGKPEAFRFLCRGAVSAKRRDEIAEAGKALGIHYLTIWSGVEFEERLRLHAEHLLRRFVKGEIFPDNEKALKKFVDEFPGLSDDDVLDLMAPVFDRPAFRTPFQQESSLPAFRQAIEDTIAALNTGIWRTRDGTEIRRLPSVHHLKNAQLKEAVGRVIRLVDELRRIFVGRLRDGSIKPCGCGKSDCPVFMMQDGAVQQLDRARDAILETFRSIYPNFRVTLR